VAPPQRREGWQATPAQFSCGSVPLLPAQVGGGECLPSQGGLTVRACEYILHVYSRWSPLLHDQRCLDWYDSRQGVIQQAWTAWRRRRARADRGCVRFRQLADAAAGVPGGAAAGGRVRPRGRLHCALPRGLEPAAVERRPAAAARRGRPGRRDGCAAGGARVFGRV